jgi:predicted nuclease with TOPRIM domain
MAPDKDLFEEDTEEPEILPDLDSSVDEKLDQIIDLLKKNHAEHQEIRERLDKIEKNQKTLAGNQDAAFSAWQQFGIKLGELEERCDSRHAPKPMLLAAEMASQDPK